MTWIPPIETEEAGAGLFGAGVGPGGIYVPASVADSPTPSAGSRFINPISRDYELNSETGQEAQMPPTRQRVLLALMTKRGSSTARPDFGLRVPDKIRTTFEAEMRINVRAALSHLTREDAPVIVIDGIDVQVPRPGRALITVSYTDVLNGVSDEASALVS